MDAGFIFLAVTIVSWYYLNYNTALAAEPVDCYDGNGSTYRGTVSETESGRTCQAWSSDTPHQQTYQQRYPDTGLESNYCRNPDGEKRPWCFTTDPEKTWELCNILVCADADCYVGNGKDYLGKVNTTVSGIACQWWNSTTPHRQSYPQRFPTVNLEANYCRNPDGEPSPWCFTTNPMKAWELCDIAVCTEQKSSSTTEAPTTETLTSTSSTTTTAATVPTSNTPLPTNAVSDSTDCYVGDGYSYRGKTSSTVSGRTCQRWDSRAPHFQDYNQRYPDGGLQANYCRNPDGEPGPWCFTIDPRKTWEMCDIPVCSNATTTPGNVTASPSAGNLTVQVGDSTSASTSSETDIPSTTVTTVTTTPPATVTTILAATTTSEASMMDCYVGDGSTYRGTVSETESGRTCQAWSSDTPHRQTYQQRYPDAGLESNYCRNPDGEKRPWCFTTDPQKTWELCNAKECVTTSTSAENTLPTTQPTEKYSTAFVEITAQPTYLASSEATTVVMETTSMTSPSTTRHAVDCYLADGSSYRGRTSVTKSGRQCQAWQATQPHIHIYMQRFPNSGLELNYCRNPDGESGPWCFTTDPRKTWELCDIPKCEATNHSTVDTTSVTSPAEVLTPPKIHSITNIAEATSTSTASTVTHSATIASVEASRTTQVIKTTIFSPKTSSAVSSAVTETDRLAAVTTESSTSATKMETSSAVVLPTSSATRLQHMSTPSLGKSTYSTAAATGSGTSASSVPPVLLIPTATLEEMYPRGRASVKGVASEQHTAASPASVAPSSASSPAADVQPVVGTTVGRYSTTVDGFGEEPYSVPVAGERVQPQATPMGGVSTEILETPVGGVSITTLETVVGEVSIKTLETPVCGVSTEALETPMTGVSVETLETPVGVSVEKLEAGDRLPIPVGGDARVVLRTPLSGATTERYTTPVLRLYKNIALPSQPALDGSIRTGKTSLSHFDDENVLLVNEQDKQTSSAPDVSRVSAADNNTPTVSPQPASRSGKKSNLTPAPKIDDDIVIPSSQETAPEWPSTASGTPILRLENDTIALLQHPAADLSVTVGVTPLSHRESYTSTLSPQPRAGVPLNLGFNKTSGASFSPQMAVLRDPTGSDLKLVPSLGKKSNLLKSHSKLLASSKTSLHQASSRNDDTATYVHHKINENYQKNRLIHAITSVHQVASEGSMDTSFPNVVTQNIKSMTPIAQPAANVSSVPSISVSDINNNARSALQAVIYDVSVDASGSSVSHLEDNVVTLDLKPTTHLSQARDFSTSASKKNNITLIHQQVTLAAPSRRLTTYRSLGKSSSLPLHKPQSQQFGKISSSPARNLRNKIVSQLYKPASGSSARKSVVPAPVGHSFTVLPSHNESNSTSLHKSVSKGRNMSSSRNLGKNIINSLTQQISDTPTKPSPRTVINNPNMKLHLPTSAVSADSTIGNVSTVASHNSTFVHRLTSGASWKTDVTLHINNSTTSQQPEYEAFRTENLTPAPDWNKNTVKILQQSGYEVPNLENWSGAPDWKNDTIKTVKQPEYEVPKVDNWSSAPDWNKNTVETLQQSGYEVSKVDNWSPAPDWNNDTIKTVKQPEYEVPKVDNWSPTPDWNKNTVKTLQQPGYGMPKGDNWSPAPDWNNDTIKTLQQPGYEVTKVDNWSAAPDWNNDTIKTLQQPGYEVSKVDNWSAAPDWNNDTIKTLQQPRAEVSVEKSVLLVTQVNITPTHQPRKEVSDAHSLESITDLNATIIERTLLVNISGAGNFRFLNDTARTVHQALNGGSVEANTSTSSTTEDSYSTSLHQPISTGYTTEYPAPVSKLSDNTIPSNQAPYRASVTPSLSTPPNASKTAITPFHQASHDIPLNTTSTEIGRQNSNFTKPRVLTARVSAKSKLSFPVYFKNINKNQSFIPSLDGSSSHVSSRNGSNMIALYQPASEAQAASDMTRIRHQGKVKLKAAYNTSASSAADVIPVSNLKHHRIESSHQPTSASATDDGFTPVPKKKLSSTSTASDFTPLPGASNSALNTTQQRTLPISVGINFTSVSVHNINSTKTLPQQTGVSSMAQGYSPIPRLDDNTSLYRHPRTDASAPTMENPSIKTSSMSRKLQQTVSSRHLTAAAVSGIILACVLLALVIAAATFLWRKKWAKRLKLSRNEAPDPYRFENPLYNSDAVDSRDESDAC